MSRTIIVVSQLVDATIREGQPDTTFILKHNLTELADHIETTPIRADYLYFTQEVIPHTNTSLNFLTQMLENPFLKVNKVCYITQKGSQEIESIKYIIDEKGLSNWEVIEGALTREYVSGVISGALRTDSFNRKRKALYRVPKSAYVQDRIKNKEVLEEEYIDDERMLKDVPPTEIPEFTVREAEDVAEIYHVVGGYGEERTALTFLLAQYMAQEGKTLLVEKDTEYHLLTELVTKSGVPCLQIPITEVQEDINGTIEKIAHSSQKLVVITAVERVPFSYNFICNILYANLYTHISTFMREDDYDEAPTTQRFVVALPASVIGCLRTCENLDSNYAHLAKFVAVNFQQLPETRILNSHTVDEILSDVLEQDISGSDVVNVYSLQIGGESSYDLRSILK